MGDLSLVVLCQLLIITTKSLTLLVYEDKKIYALLSRERRRSELFENGGIARTNFTLRMFIGQSKFFVNLDRWTIRPSSVRKVPEKITVGPTGSDSV